MSGTQINAAALTALREARRFTMSELAEVAGVSLPYLSQLESGARPGTARVAHKLADALGCHVLAISRARGAEVKA